MKMFASVIQVLIALCVFVGSAQGFEEWAFYFGRPSYGQFYSELTRSRENNNRIDAAVFTSYSISKDGGNILGTADALGEDLAKQFNVKRIMGLDNFDPKVGFDVARLNKLFKRSRTTNKLIAQIVQLALKNGYDGVFIDFEKMATKLRQKYLAFIASLSASLKKINKVLIVAVPAMSSDQPSGNAIGAYDYEAIGSAVDYLFLMTWDEVVGRPGPIASIPWVTDIVAYAKSVVPSNKLIIALPTYGYQYGITSPSQKILALYWWQIEQTLKQENVYDVTTTLNGALMDPSTTFKLSYPNNFFVENVIWYENYDSLLAKTEFAKEQNLAAVLVFALGYDSPKAWDAIMN